MTTPRGSSDGAMTVRAIVSQKTRNAAPKITEIGRIRRYDVPTRSRTMWGTMMPTKPISPTAETIAAVPSDDAAITMKRT